LPDLPAIVGAGASLAYGELDRRVSAAAARVQELGFGAGDRVALHLPKDERYLVLLLALIRTGCVACLLSTRLPPLGAALLPERTACRALISTSEELLEAAGVRTLRPQDLLTGEAAQDRPESAEQLWLARDQASTVVFTSGSSGVPKAALHTFGNHFYSARGSNANIELAPGDRWLHSLPLYHVGGLAIVFRCLLAGATVVAQT
jgi:O-succinylbenzoic acid--CoA ligase